MKISHHAGTRIEGEKILLAKCALLAGSEGKHSPEPRAALDGREYGARPWASKKRCAFCGVVASWFFRPLKLLACTVN